jgi:hypothetical protein
MNRGKRLQQQLHSKMEYAQAIGWPTRHPLLKTALTKAAALTIADHLHVTSVTLHAALYTGGPLRSQQHQTQPSAHTQAAFRDPRCQELANRIRHGKLREPCTRLQAIFKPELDCRERLRQLLRPKVKYAQALRCV